MKKDIFAEINQDVFRKQKGIEWFDRLGVIELSAGCVKGLIRLADTHIQSHHDAYQVKVVSTQTGELASHTFCFKDYLDKKSDLNGLTVWAGGQNGPSWCCEKPNRDELDNIAAQVMKFLGHWMSNEKKGVIR